MEIAVQKLGGFRQLLQIFDGGPLQLTSEELEQGWEQRGDIAVSPIVNEPSILPHEGYDEWYAFERDIPEFGDVELFVNYGGFSPVTLAERQVGMKWDLTWEPPRPDPFEDALLERFWTTICRLDPSVYIAEGDLLTVVTKSEPERDRVRGRLRF